MNISDCTEAYGLVKDSTSCIEGCSIHKKMLDEATANQVGFIFCYVSRKLKGNRFKLWKLKARWV